MTPTLLRCSSFDRLWKCPPAVLASGPSIIRIRHARVAEAAAKFGKAIHGMAAEFVEQGRHTSVEDSLAAAGIDDAQQGDAHKAMFYVEKAWADLEQFFPKPQVESSVTGPTIKAAEAEWQVTGTIDVCSPSPNGKDAVFLDWKSGFIDTGFHNQMLGYAYLLWHFMERPPDITITGVVVFLRHRYYRVLKYTPAQLADWEHDLIRNKLPKADQYNPGDQCGLCELYAGCHARRVVVEATLDAMMFGDRNNPADYQEYLGKAKDVMSQLTEENKTEAVVGQAVHDLLFRAKLAEQAVADTREMLREALRRVGAIATSDGQTLILRTVERRNLSPRKAMGVLRTRLSDNELADCMTLKLPAILSTFAARAGRGLRKKARDTLEAELTEAGAISLKPSERMELVETSTLEDKEQDHDNSEQPA